MCMFVCPSYWSFSVEVHGTTITILSPIFTTPKKNKCKCRNCVWRPTQLIPMGIITFLKAPGILAKILGLNHPGTYRLVSALQVFSPQQYRVMVVKWMNTTWIRLLCIIVLNIAQCLFSIVFYLASGLNILKNSMTRPVVWTHLETFLQQFGCLFPVRPLAADAP